MCFVCELQAEIVEPSLSSRPGCILQRDRQNQRSVVVDGGAGTCNGGDGRVDGSVDIGHTSDSANVDAAQAYNHLVASKHAEGASEKRN